MKKVFEGIGVWHIPQLMLEIFCNGPICKAVIFVALSADNGAKIYKLKRNDDYIMEMMSWIRLFYKEFVIHQKECKLDYGKSYEGYDDFLLKTKDIAISAELLITLDENQIQRNQFNNQYFLA